MIEINKKSDIVIPFSTIGAEGWEINTRLIIESIAENWEDDLKPPIAEAELIALEKRLGTSLPENLKLFYKTFGIADIGEQLQDLKDIGFIKEIWAEHPQYGPDFTEEDKISLPFLVSFSDYLGNGNMFCFHSETKEIYYYDHDGEPYISKMFDTIDDYFKGCLIFAQAELDSTDEQTKEWAIEIVADLVGKKIVEKWGY
jgi:SMI1 / KNR4 family (SUKH-1)